MQLTGFPSVISKDWAQDCCDGAIFSWKCNVGNDEANLLDKDGGERSGKGEVARLFHKICWPTLVFLDWRSWKINFSLIEVGWPCNNAIMTYVQRINQEK